MSSQVILVNWHCRLCNGGIMANKFFTRLFRKESKLTKAWGKICKFFKSLTESIKGLFCGKKERKEYFSPPKYFDGKVQIFTKKIEIIRENVNNIRFVRAEHRKFRRSARYRHLHEQRVSKIPTLLEEARADSTNLELLKGGISP